MSGGAYDYIYFKLSEIAYEIPDLDNPHRIAFKNHLQLVAKALQAIEWVDSGDYDNGDENEAIAAVFDDDENNITKAAVYDKIKKLTETL